MTKLSKIAILVSKDSNFTFELDEVQNVFNKKGIDSKLFYESDSILEYKPDCVIITSPQDAKLTPHPTYGLINKPRGEYLETARFLRNILTYDGFFTSSPRLKQMLGDVMFGARKLGTSVLNLDFFPAATEWTAPIIDLNQPKIIIFEPDFNNSKFKQTIFHLLGKLKNLYVVTTSIPDMDKYSQRFILAKNAVELGKILNSHSIAICLESGDQQENILHTAVIKLISSCAITIAHRTDLLESYFDDNLFYIPADASADVLHKAIEFHLKQILEHPEAALKKCRQAHEIFLQTFAFDHLLEKFIDFHAKTLVDKGYVPHPDPAREKSLPSVSYIVRTGGKHRHFLERTLDCLVAQQYPDLRAILVVHARFPYINEIIEKYPSLKIKVVESIKSMRSEAIRDGMAAVETELFGLFDDDDEIFPNHVRMLVKTLQYHANRDWRGEISMVYSGSIHADDTHSVPERAEFQDHKLTNKHEKRAIEHFKFFSSTLMSQHLWFMPNGWLARAKFIDEELLTDPQLDTCEDLYFELQFAQRGFFAFSAEVTAIHHFHHFGNSTFVDSHKHWPDTHRIAIRNFGRVYPPDSLYDTDWNIVGKLSSHDPNQIAYQDYQRPGSTIAYPSNPFYPFRNRPQAGTVSVAANAIAQARQHGRLGLNVLFFPIKGIKYAYKFIRLDRDVKNAYLNKLMTNIEQHGYVVTFIKAILFFINHERMNTVPSRTRSANKKFFLSRIFTKVKHVTRFMGWKKSNKLAVKKDVG